VIANDIPVSTPTQLEAVPTLLPTLAVEFTQAEVVLDTGAAFAAVSAEGEKTPLGLETTGPERISRAVWF
jgi:hypothetical protein